MADWKDPLLEKWAALHHLTACYLAETHIATPSAALLWCDRYGSEEATNTLRDLIDAELWEGRELKRQLDGQTFALGQTAHVWLPLSECPPMPDGKYWVMADDYGRPWQALYRRHDGNFGKPNAVTHVLSPSLGPIPEAP